MMRALSMAVIIHLSKAGRTLFIRGLTVRKLGRNNLMARNLTTLGLIVVGLTMLRTKK